MQGERDCRWLYSMVVPRCAIRGCVEEAFFSCEAHPEEGYFCAAHRKEHDALFAATGRETDSQLQEWSKSKLDEVYDCLPEGRLKELMLGMNHFD